MLLHLKNEDLNEEIKEGKVLVDFYADWCGPCKMLAPVLEELSEERGTKIIKINVDEHEDLARKYAVMSIPTLIYFEEGNEKKKNVGFLPKDALVNWLEEK